MSAVENSFVFVNLIDTDQLYGHRLDPEGFGKSLEEFDRSIPTILSKLKDDDVLVITGDHGNDPCSESTDHSREFVPLLVYPKSKTLHQTDNPSDGSMNLGTRETFADVAVSVADFFEIKSSFPGKSFLK